MLININIEKKHPTVVGSPSIVCGNNGYQIKFQFDEEWEGLTHKTARFVYRKGGKVCYIDEPFAGDTVDVPILSGISCVLIGVYTDILRTTTPAKIPCEYSIRCNSGERAEEYTPDIYEKLVALFNTVDDEHTASLEAATTATSAAATATEAATTATKAAASVVDKQVKLDTLIRTRNKSAAGLIYPLATEKVPEGFLLCDGEAYSRTEYKELFEAIGTIYGAGDGSTTFNVPDLATRVPVGAGGDYGLGITGGAAEHTLTEEQMPKHRHELTVDGNEYYGEHTWFTEDGSASGVYLKYGNRGDSGGALLTTMVGSSGPNDDNVNPGTSEPHNNMQPYTVVNYIISTGKEIEFVVGGAPVSALVPIAGEDLDRLAASENLVVGTLYLTTTDTNDDYAFVNAPAGTLYLAAAPGTLEKQMNLMGKDGQDYVLTKADKEEIAQAVISMLPIYNGEVI